VETKVQPRKFKWYFRGCCRYFGYQYILHICTAI